MCTVGFIRRHDSSVLLFGTSDNPVDTRTSLLVQGSAGQTKFIATRVHCPGENSLVPWNGMLTRGINEYGIAFTWAATPADTERKPDNALTLLAAGKEILTNVTNLASIKLLLATNNRDFSGNFYFADSDGNVLYAEVDKHEHQLLDCSSLGHHAATNHRQLCSIPQSPGTDGHSVKRLAQAYSLLECIPATIEGITGLLSSVDASDPECSICVGTEANATCASVSAEILSPSEQTIWYCYGLPCIPESTLPDKSLANMSWQTFQAFRLADHSAGTIVSSTGVLTGLPDTGKI